MMRGGAVRLAHRVYMIWRSRVRIPPPPPAQPRRRTPSSRNSQQNHRRQQKAPIKRLRNRYLWPSYPPVFVIHRLMVISLPSVTHFGYTCNPPHRAVQPEVFHPLPWLDFEVELQAAISYIRLLVFWFPGNHPHNIPDFPQK